MIINLKLTQDSEFIQETVSRGSTIEEIYLRHKDEISGMIIAAKVNNRYQSLTTQINEKCNIELLDMRVHVGRLVYQHGLIMIYLRAVEEVLGRSKVEVMNALSKGLYTEIDDGADISEDDLMKLQKKMEEIVEKDIPFERSTADRKEMLLKLDKAGLSVKKRAIESIKRLKKFEYYNIGEFYNYFYGFMVPSTGYIKGFSLRKYRRGILLLLPHERTGSGLQYIDDRKLYGAFRETKKWQELLGIPFAFELNEKIRNDEIKNIILLSEALHEQNIIEIARRIIDEKKRIILISGPSSSGKTTFARKLCIQLAVNGKKPLYLGTDDYFLNREDTPLNEKGERDYESLSAVDVELFNSDMNDLLAGKEVDLPVFDFMEGKKIFGKRITKISPGDPIVIEGIHALNSKMTPKLNEKEKFKIYISPLTQLNIDDHNRISITDARMLRRIVRDYQFRGHSAQNTIKLWPAVRAGENKNVFPYNGEADIFVNTMHIYEIGVLKKYAEPLLKAITPEEEEYAEARRLLQFLQFFVTIDNDEYIANTSLLREFIGGSIFVD